MVATGLPSFDAVVPAPFGGIGVRVAGAAVAELVYLPPSVAPAEPRGTIAREAARQLRAYLADAAFRFDLALVPRGTAFQRRVWDAIAAVPPGAAVTYGQIARLVRSAPRAVGQACGANWYPLVIPCHRVLAAGGIGGFANHDDGFHLGVKRWLLSHEGVAGYV
ncbi:MAG: methylated-DNA--[protein]-cysteine S-methyltransferase [Burkholderiales bacterium]|nr:methylated-DNA--[protein]-cysteine S-methyltransferase [Burkholderiales bacterium]